MKIVGRKDVKLFPKKKKKSFPFLAREGYDSTYRVFTDN